MHAESSIKGVSKRQTVNSPERLEVWTDAESPAHCRCHGTAQPVRNNGHCSCIEIDIQSEISVSPEPHDVVLDSESPSHCHCPSGSAPARNTKHCECVKSSLPRDIADSPELPSYLKREIAPISSSSAAPSTSAVKISRSTVTVPKSSGTGVSSFATTTKPHSTGQNSSESTSVTSTRIAHTATQTESVSGQVTKTTTTKVATPDPVSTDVSDFEIDTTIDLLPLLQPPLFCFFGACFPTTQLSEITGSSNIFKRGLPPPVGGACDAKETPACLEDQRACFCHISKRSLPQDSIAHRCPDDRLLICDGTKSGACHCLTAPPSIQTPFKPAFPASVGSAANVVVQGQCQAGSRMICHNSLCYCSVAATSFTSTFMEGLGPK